MMKVILPQAIRIATPPTVGFMVQIIKNTSLASVVGFVELMRSGADRQQLDVRALHRSTRSSPSSISPCAIRCRCSARSWNGGWAWQVNLAPPDMQQTLHVEPIVSLRDVQKSFGALQVLDGV